MPAQDINVIIKKVSKLTTAVKRDLPNFVLDTMIDVEMPMGIIDKDGRRVINDLLIDNFGHGLPDFWDYRVRVGGKGEYVGSFSKRASKYFYQEYNKKLTSEFLGKLGDLVTKHTNKNSHYQLEYVQHFDWQAGDFGDAGSCFWGCHKYARTALEKSGAYAIRFYDTNNRGIARAWIYKKPHFYVVFNGYGMETIDIARIMAHQLNLSYRRVKLYNLGDKEGFIWLNGSNGHGNGFVIGFEAKIHGLSVVDLEIMDTRSICSHCRGQIEDESTMIIHNKKKYCKNCYSNYFTKCQKCDDIKLKSDMLLTHNEHVCKECAAKYYTPCNCCGNQIDKDKVKQIVDRGKDSNLCERCIKTFFDECSKCHMIFPKYYFVDSVDNCCPNCCPKDSQNKEDKPTDPQK